MFLYENDRCPVCSKPFEQGDDIVTCPECGTPHHRECYKDYGGCKNRSLHGEDFVYKRNSGEGADPALEKVHKNIPFLRELPFEEDAKSSEYYEPDNAEASDKPEENTEIAQIAPEVTEAEDNADKIDGVATEDVASVIAVNSVKFIPKFRRNKMLNWNWSAFFFGPYYLFFRKMYVQGAVFIALEYGFRLAITAAFLPAFVAAGKAMADVKTVADYYAAANNFMADPEYQNFMTATALITAVLILVHVLCALLADSLYRKKVFNIIRIVDEKIKMGESFSLMGPMMAMETNLSQKDMRRIFLSRQGGVNPWAPLFAMVLIEIVLSML